MVVASKFKVIKQGVEYEFEPAAEGGYVVTVPLYSSCVSQGESFEEALASAEDALKGCLAAARDLKLPIPPELENFLKHSGKL